MTFVNNEELRNEVNEQILECGFLVLYHLHFILTLFLLI